MKMLAHKSTTSVAYFPFMLPLVPLALSVIFHEVLSLKLKAQYITAKKKKGYVGLNI